MNKKIMLWFDVEDYVTPETEESLLEILKLTDAFGVKCTLKLCTMKYRQLKQRGRTDILKLMANHELAFHMTDHSVHPLPTEYLDRMGFGEGAVAFDQKEFPGFLELGALSGQNLTSYGHPGVAWAPQVFPALRRWGVPTYLDVHDIVGIDGKPFWYGGVLSYTGLVNLAHLAKDGSTDSMIRSFDGMALDGEETVFLSIYDHPHEIVTTQFWDEVNFAGGRNSAYLTPSALRSPEESRALFEQYRAFLAYTTKQPDVEYVTALESMRFERQRKTPITADGLRDAVQANGAEANYAKIGDAYCTPSETLNLIARHLTGKVLTPELLYGPEEDTLSIVTGPVDAQALAHAVLDDTKRALGFKQLPDAYRIGQNLISPADAYATLAKALLEGAQTLDVQKGRLGAADNVNENSQFGGGWVLWDPDFQPEGIFRHTKLQCWTLKPAVF
ncbi:MAG: hypothetical protein LBR77_08780 [Lachnospiraceae bacterium]|jgi:hypothetical protein|nr:hypothetical protein [Lachnospiraceae bacterium]